MFEIKGFTMKTDNLTLRRRAEEFLDGHPEAVNNIPAGDLHQLIEDLHVHQIELEMQNEELRRTQLELEKARDRYSDLYDFAPVGYFTISDKGFILEANLNGARLFNIERRNLIDEKFNRLIPPHHQDEFYHHCNAVFKSKKKQACDLELVRKDGTRFYARLESVAIQEKAENSRQIRTAVTDITDRRRFQKELQKAHDELERRVEERTADLVSLNEQLQQEIEERKHAEKALIESEVKYRTLFDVSTHAIFLETMEGRVLDGNRSACEMFGYTKEELTGLTVADLVPQEVAKALPEIISEQLSTGGIFEETTNKRKDGHIFPVEISTRLFTLQGEQLVLAHIHDITHRKQAEEALETERQRLYSVLDELPAFVYLEAADHSLRFANRYFREQFGDWEGRKCYELLRGIKEPCKECPTLKVIETGKPQVWEGLELRDERSYQIYDYPFTDIDGSQLVLELGIDITKRKQTESELRRLSSRLLNAQEDERRRISFELHDELGQDLTVLKLHIDSIKRKLHQDQSALHNAFKEVLLEVNQTIEKVRRISRDLSPSVLVDLGLNAALRGMLKSFTKHSKIEISTDIQDTKNLFSSEQQIAVYRIFQEIITNISKHAHASKVSIVGKKKSSKVFFRVKDNGIGFDIEEINAMYAPEKGLGLAAMAERAKMLYGHFEISSQVNSGTIIDFEVPIDSSPELGVM